MIPRAPSLFHIEEGAAVVVAATAAPTTVPASRELVGLRLIIQPSPRQRRLPTVLRRSSAAAANKCHETNGRTMFAGLEFLKCCSCCHKKLGADMDVFVYRGEHAFCSADCRSRHIAREERREMETLVRKRRDAFHSRHAAPPAANSTTEQGSNRRRLIRLQIAA